MQAEGVGTRIFWRGGLLVFLHKPHYTSILIDEVLREKRGLLGGDDELWLVGIEDEDVEVIEQQVIMKVFTQPVEEIDVGTGYHIVQSLQDADVLDGTLGLPAKRYHKVAIGWLVDKFDGIGRGLK